MDYNNITLLARERHAELIKDAAESNRQVNSHVITMPSLFDRAVAGVKALFAKPANEPKVTANRTLATK